MRVKKNKMRHGLILRGQKWYALLKSDGKWRWKVLEAISWTEAVEERKHLQREINQNYGRAICPITFNDLAEKWLKAQSIGNKPRTIASYRFQIDSHLKPFFGPKRADKIFLDSIDEYKQRMVNKTISVKKIVYMKIVPEIVSLMLNGNFISINPKIFKKLFPKAMTIPSTKKMSSTTINYDLRVLKSILEFGLKRGHLQRNPASEVDRLKQKKRQFEILDRFELNKLLDSIDDSQDKLLIMTASMTGMRLGELLAMKWQNLDPRNGVYFVKESYSEFGFDVPKTEASARRVVLDERVAKALREHQARQWEQQAALKDIYRNQGLVFATPQGNPINPTNVRLDIHLPSLRKAGINKHVRFHDLRRTYISLAFEAGATLKFVMDQVGHKDSRMTLGIYAQVTDAKKREEASKLSDYIFGKPLASGG